MGSENKRLNTLKRLSDTRWASHAQATKALYIKYKNILNVLINMSTDETQNAQTKEEARSLAKKMNRLEPAFMCVFWNTILQRFQTTSSILQTVNLDLMVAMNMLKSLSDFVEDVRNQFGEMERSAKEMSATQEYRSETARQGKRKKASDESNTPGHILSGSDNFRVEVFFVIIDKLVSMLRQRSGAYGETCSYFGFLTALKKMSTEEVRTACRKFTQKYSTDLQGELGDELVQFVAFCRTMKSDLSPISLMTTLKERELQCAFPNVVIALRIYLTLPVSNATGERSFSKLGLIKNCLRTTMTENRLNHLTVMSIEHDLLRQMDFEDLIHDFASKKSRRRAI